VGSRGARKIASVVCAPPVRSGGVKSLYSVCEWLSRLGRSRIFPFWEAKLASWFDHRCKLYDGSYSPDVLIYPEVYQPYLNHVKYHVCFAVGKYRQVAAHADLTVCKSPDTVSWVKAQHPSMPTALIRPSIDRSVFAYDGRLKKDLICYMTTPRKHPETAELLRRRYADRFVEIIERSEREVAEILKDAKVFVWRGDEREGSPRPPKEALVAGCVVVGLKSDLNERYLTDWGVQCSTLDELLEMAGEALKMPMPTEEQRAVVRDKKEEMADWLRLVSDFVP
jgi:hypothetical protein